MNPTVNQFIFPRMSTQKFRSPTIFQLQQELIRARKELSHKQNQWKQQKVLLLQKNDLTTMQLNEMKQLSTNLKKINETLTLAQREKRFDTTMGDIKEFKQQMEKKTEREIRYEIQQEYRVKSSKIKQTYQDSLQAQLQQQQKTLRKKFHAQLTKLQSDNEFLRTRSDELQSQLNFSHSEINQLRDELSLATNSITSFRSSSSSSSDKFLNFINNSKQSSSQQDLLNSSSNVISKMLCEVCGEVYTTNDFFEHVQECQREEQENYEELLERKREIESQLEMLEYDTRGGKGGKIIMIVNEKQGKRRKEREGENKERSFVKSYKNSPSNSFIESNLKASNKNRY